MTEHEEVDYKFTPNPQLNAESWEQQYPPIDESVKLLRNKFTDEIVYNTPEFAKRSDCFEPYYGELPRAVKDNTSAAINQALAANSNNETQVPSSGLIEL